MATLQELVTKYTLDDGNYKAGADRVVTATDHTVQSIERLGMTITGSIRSGFSSLTAPISGLISGAGLLGLVKYSLNAAESFDTLERSLTAITGSATRARQVLSFVDKLAIPSIFTSAELAQASTTLEAFQLRTERFLPVAEKLATVFGGKAEDLRQFVDALGMIKGQRFGEGFESLARAGISRDSLKVRGLSFDRGGEFKGNVDQALKAVEDEVDARFGKLSDQMASGPAAKMASVMDALGRSAREAGFEGLGVLIPIAEKTGDVIQKLIDTGKIRGAAASIAGIFNADAISSKIPGIIESVVRGAEQLPGIFAKTKGVLDEVTGIAGTLHHTIGKDFLFSLDLVLHTAQGILQTFRALPGPIQQALVTMLLVNKMTGGLAGSLIGQLGSGLSGGGGSGGLGGLLNLPVGQAFGQIRGWITSTASNLKDLRAELTLNGITGARQGVVLLGQGIKDLSQVSITGTAAIYGVVAAFAIFGKAVYDAAEGWRQAELDRNRRVTDNSAQGMSFGEYVRMRRAMGDQRKAPEMIPEYQRKFADFEKRRIDKWNQEHGGDKGKPEDKAAAAQANLLQQIEQHTKATADNTSRDFGSHALGGGNLGRIGAAEVELRQLRRISARVQMPTGADKITQGVIDLINEALHSAQRQGLLGT